MISKIKNAIRDIIIFFFSIFPVQKKIVFINFNGRGFGCNPKYIALKCIETKLDVDMVWLVNNYYDDIPIEIRQVKWGNVRFFYELATAKVIITNVKNRLPFKKKKSQWMMQTWHGSHAFKFVEKEAEDQLSPDYVRASKENSRITDLFISDSPLTSKWYRDAFYCECEIAETGSPRDDILFCNSSSIRKKIRERLCIDDETKLILYAPTFRSNNFTKSYDFDYNAIITTMHEKFGGDWKVMLRAHPNETWRGEACDFSDEIINVSKWGDVQELCIISDVLITDYSAICNDFFKMNKPVFLYVPDFDDYIKNNRRLKKNYYELPLNRNLNTDELKKEILNFDADNYFNNITAYKKKYQFIKECHASDKVVQIINAKLNCDYDQHKRGR